MRYLVLYSQKSNLIAPALYETTLEGVLSFLKSISIRRIRAVDVRQTPGAVDGVEIFYDSMLIDASVTFIALGADNAA